MIAVKLNAALVCLFQVNMWSPAKMGLSNITRLHEALGNPMDGLPAVHIAGTNGKVTCITFQTLSYSRLCHAPLIIV